MHISPVLGVLRPALPIRYLRVLASGSLSGDLLLALGLVRLMHDGHWGGCELHKIIALRNKKEFHFCGEWINR